MSTDVTDVLNAASDEPVANTRQASGETANRTGSVSVISLNSELPPHMLTIIVENTVPMATFSGYTIAKASGVTGGGGTPSAKQLKRKHTHEKCQTVPSWQLEVSRAPVYLSAFYRKRDHRPNRQRLVYTYLARLVMQQRSPSSTRHLFCSINRYLRPSIPASFVSITQNDTEIPINIPEHTLGTIMYHHVPR